MHAQLYTMGMFRLSRHLRGSHDPTRDEQKSSYIKGPPLKYDMMKRKECISTITATLYFS